MSTVDIICECNSFECRIRMVLELDDALRLRNRWPETAFALVAHETGEPVVHREGAVIVVQTGEA